MATTLNEINTQRWDIGTQGNMGSQTKSTRGWTLSVRAAFTQTSIGGLICTFTQNGANATGQSLFFFVNAKLSPPGGSLVNGQDCIMINVGGAGDVGFLWWVQLPFSITDGVMRTFTWTCNCNTSTNDNHVYVDGVEVGVGGGGGTWSKDYNDPVAACSNYTNAIPIGCDRKTGGVWFNHLSGTLENARIWDIALTAGEAYLVHKLKGTDRVQLRYLRSSYSFFVDGKNTGTNGTAATAAGGTNPTVSSTTRFSAGSRPR